MTLFIFSVIKKINGGLMADTLYGVNPVIEALKAGKRRAVKLYLSGKRHDKYEDIIRQFSKRLSLPLEIVDKRDLDNIALTQNHQGVAGIFQTYPYSGIKDMLDYAKQKKEKPFLIALDEIQDPQNVGAIIRTASCLGVHGVIITKRHSSYITPAVAKASAGATEYMNISIVPNLRAEIESLKRDNLIAIAMDENGTNNFNDIQSGNGIILAIGSEGNGIRKPVFDVCDYSVSIPLKSPISSLNASVSAGIGMYMLINNYR